MGDGGHGDLDQCAVGSPDGRPPPTKLLKGRERSICVCLAFRLRCGGEFGSCSRRSMPGSRIIATFRSLSACCRNVAQGKSILEGGWAGLSCPGIPAPPSPPSPRDSNDVPALLLAGCFNHNVVPTLLPGRQLRDDVAVRTGGLTATPGRRCGK